MRRDARSVWCGSTRESGATSLSTLVRDGLPTLAIAPDARYRSCGMTTSLSDGLFGWWRVAEKPARRALVAAAMGWALDAFDVMLFSLTLASVIKELGLTKTEA